MAEWASPALATLREWVWCPCASARSLVHGRLELRAGRAAERWSGSTVPVALRRRMPKGRITVLLVDDHHLVRRGFRRMLEDERESGCGRGQRWLGGRGVGFGAES